MSATNRGLPRLKKDQYFTPDWLIKAILPYVLPMEHSLDVLEPACGTGSIVNEINNFRLPSQPKVDAMDIEYQGCGREADFLKEHPIAKYDLIITNPPYSLAMQFVQHALKFRRTEKSIVAMLLRLNWLGTLGRKEWLRDNTPSVYVSPQRPKFSLNKNGKLGSDACEYGWFVWNGREPTVVILDT